MRKLAIVLLVFPLATFFLRAQDQSQEQLWEITTPNGELVYDLATGLAVATNGVVIKQGGSVLTAHRAKVNEKTYQAEADGDVRIQLDDQVFVGEHIRYNFKTGVMESEQFRSGKDPFFMEGKGLSSDTNEIYTARDAMVTMDDVSEPLLKVRTKHLVIVQDKYVEATHATLYVGNVPVFYFPFYRRTLGARANHFNFTPGYRSRFGPFLLGSYNWFWNDELDGAIHLDYRIKRGVAGGPDLNFHLGRWGDGSLRYYYLRDQEPEEDLSGKVMPENRQRFYFSWLAHPFTNFNVRSQVRYQSDPRVVREFFEGEYRQNPQPSTFVEVNKFWDNFSLDAYVQPQVNDFFETVERLPDVRLTGFRQQLGDSYFYYESESSAGYYRRLFAETNGPALMDYSAARADTYHQVVMPLNFFGWLNFTPRIGGRFTYYGETRGPGAATDEEVRGVFNTGAELSTKASRVWPGAQSKLLDADGLRHIVQPSLNYVFVPAPNRAPKELPQFDYELPSLRLQPLEFPDYNAIDSIDSQNVFRLGLRNRLQTKRDGAVENLVDWQVFTDWRLVPHHRQKTFADVYSDLVFRPRNWIALESVIRYDINSENWTMSYNTLTLQPNETWSWSLGHFYLRDDLRATTTALGVGNNLIRSAMLYRLNENWGFRAVHHFEARDGRLEEQLYTIYKDMRSWTGALSLRLRDHRNASDDFTIAVTFSIKAFPRFGVNSDVNNPYSLLGGS